jgi:hypothetical protein
MTEEVFSCFRAKIGQERAEKGKTGFAAANRLLRSPFFA